MFLNCWLAKHALENMIVSEVWPLPAPGEHFSHVLAAPGSGPESAFQASLELPLSVETAFPGLRSWDRVYGCEQAGPELGHRTSTRRMQVPTTPVASLCWLSKVTHPVNESQMTAISLVACPLLASHPDSALSPLHSDISFEEKAYLPSDIS